MPVWFVVIREKGPAWDHSRPRRDLDGWDEHATIMDALAEEAFVVLGGPLGDGDGDDALLILDAPDERTIHARLAEDPWPREMLATTSVRPWNVLLRRPNAL